jgi:FAD/FMN-containing dehydrogenase
MFLQGIGGDISMKRIEQAAQILIYLFKPEDTTELATIGMGIVNDSAGAPCSWLGTLKAVLWMAIAVAGPILTLMFLSWIVQD